MNGGVDVMKMDIGIVGGSIAGTALADRLLQAGHRVAVLERQQIKKVIGNLQLEKESASSKYFDQETTKRTGKLVWATVRSHSSGRALSARDPLQAAIISGVRFSNVLFICVPGPAT